MSANPYRTIVLDDIKYRLVPIEEETQSKKYYTIEEVSKLSGYSIKTIYIKRKEMKLGSHYFKPNNGKLLFDESAIDFLVKGGENGESLHKRRQSICLDNVFAQ